MPDKLAMNDKLPANDWKQNIYFVLIETKEPGNIGASARAIKNMGFTNLCLVKPPPEMSEEGRWFARNAHDVLDSADKFDSVDEAIKDKAIVAGTSRRGGKRRGVTLNIEEGAARVRDAAEQGKVAVLFGREARGLNNGEIDECGFMISIPSSEIQPSLNLSQAVLITAYELSKCGPAREKEHSMQKKRFDNSSLLDELKAHEELAPLYDRIAHAMELLEYLPKGDRTLIENMKANLRHFIGRAGITGRELNMLRGLCVQIEKKVGRK